MIYSLTIKKEYEQVFDYSDPSHKGPYYIDCDTLKIVYKVVISTIYEWLIDNKHTIYVARYSVSPLKTFEWPFCPVIVTFCLWRIIYELLVLFRHVLLRYLLFHDLHPEVFRVLNLYFLRSDFITPFVYKSPPISWFVQISGLFRLDDVVRQWIKNWTKYYKWLRVHLIVKN